MVATDRLTRAARLLAVLLATGALAGCANKDQSADSALLGPGGKGGPVTPGTQRDFTVNVGDLVYFSSDSSI